MCFKLGETFLSDVKPAEAIPSSDSASTQHGWGSHVCLLAHPHGGVLDSEACLIFFFFLTHTEAHFI